MIEKSKITLDFERSFPIKFEKNGTDASGTVIFPFHWHEYIEIIRVKGGKADVKINDELKTVGEDELVFVNNTQTHLLTADQPHTDVYSMYIPLEFLRDEYGSDTYIYPLYLKTSFIEPFVSDESCIKLFDDAAAEYFSKDKGYELQIKADVLSLICRLLRGHTDESDRFKSGSVRMYDEIVRCVNYIDENYADRTLIDRLPGVAGLEQSYFAKKFKRVTGMTPVGYINKVRLRKANELLLFTELPVSEISDSVGFDTPNYFISRYHEAYGKTPLAMRKDKA